MKQVLSLGAGVQSTTVLLMSIHGELPPLDAVIFADTGWEPQEVYRHLDGLVAIMAERQVPFYRVSAGNIKQSELRGKVRGVKTNNETFTALPYHTKTPLGSGILKRQCTSQFKIRPIERCLKQQVLGLTKGKRLPKELVVRHWYGISHDERQRMRTSLHAWCENWYPLVDLRMTRQACIEWCLAHGYPEPPRSACIACPFKSNREWRHLQKTSPAEFADAADFDQRIRKCGGMRGDVYVHGSLRPLVEIDLRSDVEKGQQMFTWDDECAGVCNV